MNKLLIWLTAFASLTFAHSAGAGLVLEYIEVPNIAAGPSSGPALTSLTMTEGATRFLQVALRDTTGNSLAWNNNGGLAGPGSLGLGSFIANFRGIPLVAINPAPSNAANVRLVDQGNYGLVACGCPPGQIGTVYGGLLNFGSEPGSLPDPSNQNRIALINLRINALGAGSGVFTLRDPNPAPAAVDFSALLDADPFLTPNPGTVFPIDQLIFGPNSVNTFNLPVVVTPEPSALALIGVAALAFRRMGERRGLSSPVAGQPLPPG